MCLPSSRQQPSAPLPRLLPCPHADVVTLVLQFLALRQAQSEALTYRGFEPTTELSISCAY